MKLLWRNDIEMPSFPQIEGELSTDVLIIGGGMAGILTAYFLHQKGVNYVLLEKDRICSGVTVGTTAKITFQHGLMYDKLLKSTDLKTAKMYLMANYSAFKKYRELAKTIDCDYSVADNYVYSTDDYKKLENEVSALKQIGYKAELCNPKLPFRTVGAVKFPNQAEFHPLKFIAGLSRDLNIYEKSFIKEMVGTTAICDNAKVRAKKVIVTTHFPFINKHGSYFLKLYQHRSYTIALSNAENVGGMFVDEKKTGISLRNYKDLLLVCGGGHRTGKKGGGYDEIREFAKKYYPNSKEEFHWATQDCMSLDDVYYIGQYSKNTPNMFTATGFNKWGMTGSMLSAMILSDLVCGKQNKFAEIFNPSRSILKPQLAINGFEAVTNILTFSKKRCPHLGCALKWNPQEHTWDCACHGSRFREDGKLLNNPANDDLKI